MESRQQAQTLFVQQAAQCQAYEGSLCFPRPQRPRSQQPTVQSAVQSSFPSFGSSNELELLEIMTRPADAPTATYLGVSPPVRSGCWGGATNPWSHDRSWKLSAYSASSTNLQALRELDSEGESFLKAKDTSTGKLVLAGSTDAPVVDSADCSDAGSDTTAVNECTPFTCHTEYFLV